MAEEVAGKGGRSSVRWVELDRDSDPGFEVGGVESALCVHSEHKRNYEFKRIDSRGQAGEYR